MLFWGGEAYGINLNKSSPAHAVFLVKIVYFTLNKKKILIHIVKNTFVKKCQKSVFVERVPRWKSPNQIRSFILIFFWISSQNLMVSSRWYKVLKRPSREIFNLKFFYYQTVGTFQKEHRNGFWDRRIFLHCIPLHSQFFHAMFSITGTGTY